MEEMYMYFKVPKSQKLSIRMKTMIYNIFSQNNHLVFVFETVFRTTNYKKLHFQDLVNTEGSL